MEDKLHGDEVGLLWVDPKVSARNLARGTFNQELENPFAVAFAESLAEKERLLRDRAKLESRLKALTREEELNAFRIERQQEALQIYSQTGEIRHELIPECRAAVTAEMAKQRKALHASLQPEVDALRAAQEADGWAFAHRKTDGNFLLVTLKKALKQIASALKPVRRFKFERNVRRALDKFSAPGLPRPTIARRALEIFMLNLRPSQAAMFPLKPAAP